MRNDSQLLNKTFSGLLLINVLTAVSGILCILIDAIVTGQFLGTQAVAAAGLINPVTMLANVFGILLGPGTGVVCTRYVGKAKPERVNQVFSVVIITQVIAVGTLSVLMFVGAPALGALLGGRTGDAVIIQMVTDYLHGYAFGIIPMCMMISMAGLMMLDNDRRRGLIATIVTLVTDVIFDLLNVTVFHGGMLGMAIATTLSQLLGLIVMLMHFLRKERLLRFTWKDLHPGDLIEVMSCGVANIITSSSNAIRGLLFNRILLVIAGSGAVAALSVANSSFSVIMALTIGLFISTSTMSSLLYGEEDRNGIVKVLGISMRFSLIFFSILAVVFFVLARPLAGLFLDASAVTEKAMGARFIRCMSAQYLLNSITYSLCGAYQGTLRLKYNYILTFMRECVLPILCCALFGYLGGADTFGIGFVSAGLLSLIIFILVPAIRNHKFSIAPKDLILLPEDFGAKPEEIFEASLHTMEDVMAVSEQVMNFCLDKGATQRTATVTSLFVEEMTGNTVQHGFSEGQKGSIDLRLVYKENEQVIRLRDNGKPFDPVNWLERNHPDDPTSGAGIRIIVGLAKEVRYVQAMGLNNIMILI